MRGQDITADAKTADKNVMYGQNVKIMLSIRPGNLRYRELAKYIVSEMELKLRKVGEPYYLI